MQALLNKIFPRNEDTQNAVSMIEQAKTWPGWENMKTSADHIVDPDGKLRLRRFIINRDFNEF